MHASVFMAYFCSRTHLDLDMRLKEVRQSSRGLPFLETEASTTMYPSSAL